MQVLAVSAAASGLALIVASRWPSARREAVTLAVRAPASAVLRAVVPASAPVRAPLLPTTGPKSATSVDRAAPLSNYLAMRDDPNSKPRLALIDAWARTALPEDSSNLLTQAMVDPDESVRERAEALFDARLVRTPTAFR